MGNNPMVGATVAVAVSSLEAGISEKLSDNFIIFKKNNYYYDL